MSISELKNFLKSIHPFENLTESQLNNILSVTNIAYYKKDKVLIAPNNENAEVLYLIIKGKVVEYGDNGEFVSLFSEADSFDANYLIYGKTKNRFIVDEELICYEVPKAEFLTLIDESKAFQNYYMENLATKISNLKSREKTGALSSFMLSRVSDIFLHKATIVDQNETIFNALQEKENSNSSCILVKNKINNLDILSIVTDTNLRREVLLKNKSLEDKISDIGIMPVITIEHNEFLFNALIQLVKNNIKRLIVTKNDEVIGVLEQIDLLSHFSNHSHLVMVQVEKATTIEQLKQAVDGFLPLIKTLFEKGVKVRHSTKLISELNQRIYKKLFFIIFPENLREISTLVIMGSEGRKEQILKTDQDNCLILKNNISEQEKQKILEFSQKFTETLISMGYPKCNGDIMISNPYWVLTEKEFISRINGWFENPKPQALMELAIIFDGLVINGNENSIKNIKEHIFNKINNNFMLSNFANLSLTFETPLSTIFSHFVVDSKHKNELDLKKGGIFAIVAGIRALALENKIHSTNTVERIKELNNKSILNREFALELMEAFDTLLMFRLKARLKKINNKEELDNYINPNSLKSLERELLKDSFKIVNKFKKFLTYHFKLDRV
jgi:CBS domain-containing protein